jgi:nicotinamide-nucleotide amidase
VTIYPAPLSAEARALVDLCRGHGLRLATAESCTGGLAAGLITSIPGASDVFDCGFVTYSNTAKTTLLGVPESLIARHGAVSEEVALAMAEGALARSGADLSVSVTGVAGPAGGSSAKPVGLVHIAAARRNRTTVHARCLFGDLGREAIRLRSLSEMLRLARLQAEGP